jgi:O-acetylhomoserine/O-acetylserine sulfhydrylase-like pyridoxal-dependent enzyme
LPFDSASMVTAPAGLETADDLIRDLDQALEE